MTFQIPSKESKRFSVDQSSDLFGNISRPRSLNFNKNGYLSLARKPIVYYTEVDDVDFETPIAIVSDDSDYYTITSGEVFRIDATTSDIGATKLTGGTPPNVGFQSDGVFFNSELHVSGTTTVNSLLASTWTSDITGLSSSFPHPLCVSEHQQYLAVGNGNTVRLYSTAYALITTLTIPSDHVVTWIRWRANLLWVGTRNIQGGNGKVFLWNGSGTAAQSGYDVGGEWAFSGCNYDFEGTIVIVSSTGQWLKFSGSGFVPLRDASGREVAFPCYYMDVTWGSSAATSNLLGKVASRGMESRGGLIYAVVDSGIDFDNGGTPDYLPNFPGGLWVFDPAVGLYHKGGVDHKKHAVVTFSSLASDVLTMSAAQVYETADPVEFITVGSLTGDIDNIIYYAIKVSSNQIKLAHTPQQALAGVNITITGAVTSAEMVMNTYQSVGAMDTERTGGICVVKAAGIPRFVGGEVVYGADVRLPSGTTIGAIMSLGMGRNVGSFCTPKLQASAATDTFTRVVSKFSYFNLPTQKLLIKYRTKKRWGLPGRQDFRAGAATWVNSTSFTINPKLYDFYSAQIGDEIEFTAGAAAGYTAHISNIVVDSSTQYTITIDEAMPDVVAAETSRFTVDNWTKLVVISSGESNPEAVIAAALGLIKKAIGGENSDDKNKSKQMELKFELRGYTDIEDTIDFEEVMLLNTPDQNYS